MSYSIIKKSMVYVLFVGLVLAVQPVNAMHGKVAQEPNSSSWLKIGACLAAGAVAACGLYAWHDYTEEREQKKLRGSQVPLAEKNRKLRWALTETSFLNQDEKERHIAYWIERGAEVECITAPDLIHALRFGVRQNTMRLVFKQGINPLVYCEVLKNRFLENRWADVKLLLEFDVTNNKNDADLNHATHMIKKIKELRGWFKNTDILLPIYFSRGLSQEELTCCLRAQEKHQSILKSLYENMLCDITSRRILRNKVEEVLNAHINENNTWIVNQYLSVENPAVDVG